MCCVIPPASPAATLAERMLVDQRRLAVIDMAQNRDDRRTMHGGDTQVFSGQVESALQCIFDRFLLDDRRSTPRLKATSSPISSSIVSLRVSILPDRNSAPKTSFEVRPMSSQKSRIMLGNEIDADALRLPTTRRFGRLAGTARYGRRGLFFRFGSLGSLLPALSHLVEGNPGTSPRTFGDRLLGVDFRLFLLLPHQVGQPIPLQEIARDRDLGFLGCFDLDRLGSERFERSAVRYWAGTASS